MGRHRAADRPERLARSWEAHRKAPFPDGLRWIDAPSGESVPALDLYIAGCVNAYLTEGNALDPQLRHSLATYAAELAAILPTVDGEGAAYVRRLIRIAKLVTHPADEPG